MWNCCFFKHTYLDLERGMALHRLHTGLLSTGGCLMQLLACVVLLVGRYAGSALEELHVPTTSVRATRADVRLVHSFAKYLRMHGLDVKVRAAGAVVAAFISPSHPVQAPAVVQTPPTRPRPFRLHTLCTSACLPL